MESAPTPVPTPAPTPAPAISASPAAPAAPADLSKKTNLVEQKSTVSKFEMEFVDFEDPDNEDDDG